MVFPLNDLNEPQPSQPVHYQILSRFQGDWVERLNVEEMFIFIDGILPFEACLYYQVLPLFIEGSRLNLGMVSPEDSSALDYVRRIISYMNYSLMPRPISSEALQAVLSAYLHQAGTQQDTLQNLSRNRPNRGSARARAEQKLDRNTQQTLIVDSPEDLNSEGGRDEIQPIPVPPPHIPFVPTLPVSESAPALTDSVLVDDAVRDLSAIPDLPAVPDLPIVPELPLESELSLEADLPIVPEFSLVSDLFLEPDLLVETEFSEVLPDIVDSVEVSTPLIEPPDTNTPPPSVPPAFIAALPSLEIQAKHLSSPVEVLATLSPKELLKELLARVLLGGIGRLYLERQVQYGRVLWSQNGVLQSVLDKLEPDTFQGLINELKLMTSMPLLRVQTPRQVEIERLYQNTRLLLRFRVMPSVNGEEEATLQVLRGAALKFYQQQQLASLERDAISIAKQLQLKVNEIRDRARIEPGLSKNKLDALPALNQMLRYIEEQLEDLRSESE
jgi:Type II secretion system (T2SS), protein E, N-terminal domain